MKLSEAPGPKLRFVSLLIAVLLAIATAACGGGEPDEESTPSPTAGATESPSPDASPSVSPGETSSPAPADPMKLTRPEDSSAHLFEAWKAGDRTEAAKFADQKAVDALFARPYTGPDPEFMGCDHEVDHYFCRYRYEGSSMTFRVDGGVSAGYFVTEVTQNVD